MSETVVTVRNVTKKYKDLLALDQVSLSLTANRIYGLLGRNGAGKTTLMSVLTAQAFATSGEALVFGEPAYENERYWRGSTSSGNPRSTRMISRRSMPSGPQPSSTVTGTRGSPTVWSRTSGCRSNAGSRSSRAVSFQPWESSSVWHPGRN